MNAAVSTALASATAAAAESAPCRPEPAPPPDENRAPSTATPNTPPATRAVRLVEEAMPARSRGTAPSTAAAIGVDSSP